MAEPVAQHLMPGETEKQGLKRRIRMHEFLMSGGVSEGYVNGIMQYSGPVVVEEYPVCPWHGEECDAWAELRAGRGEWTRLEAMLADAETERDALTIAEHVGKEEAARIAELTMVIQDLKRKLADRPRDAKALRERTPEQFEAEKAANKPKVYAAAGPKTGGNPWDKPGKSQKFDSPAPGPRIADTRDVVEDNAGALAETADTIEIEGEEDE